MITDEIIQRVMSLYSKGVQSDDSRLSKRHVYNKLLTSRARLVSQQAKKKQILSQWTYQTLPCVELVEVSPYECPCIPPKGCTILRTKHELPNPITSYSNHLIQSVTSLDGSIIYSEIGWIEKKYKNASKYISKKPDFFIRNNYLYITHTSGPKLISITGLFNDPFEVMEYPSYCDDCEDGGCNDCLSPLDTEFPIDSDMIDTLIEMAVNELLGVFTKSREDITNNSKDSAIEETK